MSIQSQKISSIELFCGTGGLALGLHNAGFSHRALYEWDKDSCDNILANINGGFAGISDWCIHQTDVRCVSYDGLSESISFVSGGPPCQPFSLGGKAQAHNDKRDMFPEAVRAVREIKPVAFLFENVKGLTRQSFKEYFDYILLQLTYPSIMKEANMTWEEHKAMLVQRQAKSSQQHEYSVQYRVVNAADYGVPQLRYRVIIVGFRNDIAATWEFPKPTHSKEALLYAKWITGEYWMKHGLPMPECPLSEDALKKVKKAVESGTVPRLPWRTTRDAIGDLPDPRCSEAQYYNNHEYRPGAKSYPGHSGSSLDEPSKTIKAGAHGVPGGENTVILDSGEVRYYTVRESARIQTFPDNYCFSASWTESMRQIGNAVPVQLAEVVGSSLYDYLRRCEK